MNYFNLLKRPDFLPLFSCQFFSAFADNIFKTGLVVLATFNVSFQTGYSPGLISGIISTVFMLPFFLLSGMAGEIANHVEGSQLAKVLKRAEVGIILLSWIGLQFDSFFLLLLCLFFSSVQATFFGPIKYSLIPAYLEPQDRIAGNGLIESSTFLAILIGTIFGSILSKQLLGFFMLLSSVAALYSSQRMVKSNVALVNTPIDWSLYANTKKLIRFAFKDRILFLSVIGLSWFWLLGCVVLTGIIPYTEETLKGDQYLAAFFMAAFTIGIGTGSYICHKLLRGNIHGGYIPPAALLMSIFLFDFVWSSDNFRSQGIATLAAFLNTPYAWRIVIDLFLLATFSGIYTVPLYALIQERSHPSRRGMAISSNNFFNSLFMIIASLMVMILTALKLSLLEIFLLTALINVIVTVKIANHVPESLRQMMLQFIFSTFYRVDVQGVENIKKAGKKSIIIANHTSFYDGLLLFAYLPFNTAFVIYHQYDNPLIRWISKGIKLFFIDPNEPMIMKHVLKHLKDGNRLVIFPEGRMTSTGSLMKINEGPSMLAEKAGSTILPIRIDGAERSRLTRLKGKIKRKTFPKITLHIQDPIRVEDYAGETPKETRQKLNDRIERLMAEMAFQTRAFEQTIFESYLSALKNHGRFTKIIEDHQKKPLSYQSMLLKIATLGAYFESISDKEEKMGVLLPTTCAGAVTLFSLTSRGRVPVMLNYSLGEERLMETIHLSKVKTVITSRKFVDNLQHLQKVVEEAQRHNKNVIYLEDLQNRKSKHALKITDKLKGIKFALTPKRSYKPYQAQPEDLALILFTSGSEREPKAVGLSHRNINANCAQITACIDFTAKDLILNVLPIYHCFGLTAGVFLPILSGVRTFLYPSPLHYKIIPTLAYDLNATIFFGTSSLLLKYGEAAHNYDFYSMRYVVAGAEKLSSITRTLWQQRFGIRIFEGYGMTEASPVVAVNTPMHYQIDSVGKILPGIEAVIKPIEGIQKGGELCLKGPNIMMGYYDGVSFTPPSEEFGYETGDIVTIDDKGFLKLTGRLKRFAKVAGEMIPLTHVEEVIQKHYLDSPMCVVSKPHPQRGEEIILVTTSEKIQIGDISNIFIHEKYPPLFCPKKIYFMEELPLMGTGKVDVATVQKIVNELQ